ncbi:MAG: hypothetical protein OJF49_001897 [Ktedonobacterales bacterium]|jgi:hypothetical protein|nr:MAG: hypothetical protein OJF49_001897 [Ktedonobacterales bacterium]
MSHQMNITLTDEEYAELAAEAGRAGKPVESVAHDMLAQRLRTSAPGQQGMTARAFLERQYRDGKVLNLPVAQQSTSAEEAERERLAQIFAQGKPASEMVIEDRGPR